MAPDLLGLLREQVELLPGADAAEVARVAVDQLAPTIPREALLPILTRVAGTLVSTKTRQQLRKVTTLPVAQTRWTGEQRKQYDAVLLSQVHTGTANKLLGDCRVADLRGAAGVRSKLAEENVAWAAKYERLAHALDESMYDTVAELFEADYKIVRWALS